ncbi:MAG TPA: hypothetical protein VMV59_05575 [Candidatus Dormibacteraeota bacterium]|nr:hypothetical protein [Candidatus Dormibacteraeota bacterium]
MRILVPSAGRKERGFALLFVLFLVALLIIGGSVALMNRLTEGRREKEAETIWRGEQYKRAIGLYYRKFGRFPTSVDDLVKAQNGIRFLREPYKNLMNTEDGSWRFIYVTPTGQLIGSVRYTSLQQMAFLDKQRQMGITTGTNTGVPRGEPSGIADDLNAQSAATSLSQSAAASGAAVPPGSSNPTQNAPPGTAAPSGQQPAQSFFSQGLQAQTGANSGMNVSESGDSSGPVIGGFIIGVAGKSDKPSIKVYKGGVTYKQWEFIFNPLEQIQTIGTTLTGPAPTGTQPPGTIAPFAMPQPPPMPQPPQIPQQQ